MTSMTPIQQATFPPATPWSAEAFEQRYQADADPWRFATSPYEQRRYRATLDALARPRYRSAFEPGCSVGALTVRLARRCDYLLATDVAPSAIRVAGARCATCRNVVLRCEGMAPAQLPPGPFDLILFSELGYYFAASELATLSRSLRNCLAPGGEFVAVHWLGQSADHQLHGDKVHAILDRHLGLPRISGARLPGFRIDSWLKPEDAS